MPSAFGGRNVRHAMQRWGPTSRMSPSSSLSLVRRKRFFLARCGLCPHAFMFANRCHLPHRIGVQRGRLRAQIQLVQHLPGYGEYSPLTPFPSLITAHLFLCTDFSHNRKHFCLKTVINPVSHRSLLSRALARPSPSLTLSGHRRT